MIILSGTNLGSMIRSNVSLLSNILSLVIETSNGALVIPGRNLTLYGPKL